MIEIHGSCTRHPPSQLISTTTEMSSPSTMSITYKNLGRIKTWIQGMKARVPNRNEITIIPKSLLGILLTTPIMPKLQVDHKLRFDITGFPSRVFLKLCFLLYLVGVKGYTAVQLLVSIGFSSNPSFSRNIPFHLFSSVISFASINLSLYYSVKGFYWCIKLKIIELTILDQL